ncbi:hypothetical protein PaMx33_ORF5 [Pseudomonas phage PaMx33]|nr:hypothetical protein PaMx33_ORF5 [Pseudomonas phage PaMx33]ANA49077.1 hypothetical protein PaMx46_ORF5 [Pseudomonas phage PaMx46]
MTHSTNLTQVNQSKTAAMAKAASMAKLLASNQPKLPFFPLRMAANERS